MKTKKLVILAASLLMLASCEHGEVNEPVLPKKTITFKVHCPGTKYFRFSSGKSLPTRESLWDVPQTKVIGKDTTFTKTVRQGEEWLLSIDYHGVLNDGGGEKYVMAFYGTELCSDVVHPGSDDIYYMNGKY